MSIGAEESVTRGKVLYEQHLRGQLEAGNIGKVLVINIETGDYKLDSDRLVTSDRAVKRFPGAPLYAMKECLN